MADSAAAGGFALTKQSCKLIWIKFTNRPILTIDFMNSRRKLRLAGKLLIAVVVFAHAALTLAACELIRNGGAPTKVVHLTSGEPCHEQDGSANLCAAHCQAEKSSLDKPQTKVIPFLLQPLLTVPLVAAPLKHANASARADACADPPPRILQHRFLV